MRLVFVSYKQRYVIDPSCVEWYNSMCYYW